MPFAGYENFADCVSKNKDKGDPEAYCGKIKHETEDKGKPKKDGSGKGTRANYNRGGCNDIIPPECLVKAYNHYKDKFPHLSERDLLDKSFNHFKNKNDLVQKGYFTKYKGIPIFIKENETEEEALQRQLNFRKTQREKTEIISQIGEIKQKLLDLNKEYKIFGETLNDEQETKKVEFNRMLIEETAKSEINWNRDIESELKSYKKSLRGYQIGLTNWKKQIEQKKGKGWHGEPERHSKARKTGKADFTQPQTLDLILFELAQDYEQEVHDFLTLDSEENWKYYRDKEIRNYKIVNIRRGKIDKDYWECKIIRKRDNLAINFEGTHRVSDVGAYINLIKSLEESGDLDDLFYDYGYECKWITKNGKHICIPSYKFDILTTDAEGNEATHLQQLMEQVNRYTESYATPEAQALRESLGGTLRPPVESINVPFTLRNSETGAIVRGNVNRNLEKNQIQLTPVSSSNVRGVGQFKDQLLVQFHGDGRTPQRTYRYQMQSPEMAEEAYNNLTNSSSPGRWVWENIRGHRAGESVTKNKLAPSLSPPGKGYKTIGGTTASLLEYSISNRVPVSRVANFEAMSEQLKRKTSNPSRNPNTGSRLEGALEGRRQARDRGVNQLGVARQVRQLPKLDFAIKELDSDMIVRILDEHGAKNKILMIKGMSPSIEPNYVYITVYTDEGLEETLEIDTKKLIQLADDIKKREESKGRGWWGESERHSQARKKGHADLTEDSFDELLDWVYENTGAKSEEEAKSIAFAIINSRKKNDKDKGKEKDWHESWREIGATFQKQREERKKERLNALEEKRKRIEAEYNVTILDQEEYAISKLGSDDPTTWEEYVNIQINRILSPKEEILARVEELKKAKKLDFTIRERNDLSFDVLDFKEFTYKTHDFESKDFSVLEGPITRSGAFPYKLGGYNVTLYKQWDNLKDVFSQVDYLPLIGSKDLGAHYAKTLGFAYNFRFDDESEKVYADIVTMEDMDKLSDNYQPDTEGWEVSIGFKDHRMGNKQIIDKADHLAVSLRNKEMGRCRYGGDPCFINYKDQNLKEVVSYTRN